METNFIETISYLIIQGTNLIQKWYEEILKEINNRQCLRGAEVINYPIGKMRDKFKKMVGKCKQAAIKQVTASGIKRFLEEKPAWFNQLFSWVKNRDSCQPEQALQPSSPMINIGSNVNDESIVNEEVIDLNSPIALPLLAKRIVKLLHYRQKHFNR